MTRGERRQGDSGSAFIEALVATSIVASVAALMFWSIEQAGARRREIDARRMALLIARSQLAEVGPLIPLTPGQVEGVSGDFTWRVRIEPGLSSALSSVTGPPALVSVSVGRPGGGDLVVLKTLRLGSGR